MINSTLKLLSRWVVARSRRIQALQGLPDLNAWGLERRADALVIGGVSAADLIERFGSPLLVLNAARLDHDIDALQNAFTCAPPGSRIFYSYKTNGIPGILQCIHARGLGAEVISPYELWLAEQFALPGSSIVYNGVSKTEESLRRAIALGVLSINADSMDELRLLRRLSGEMKRKVAVGLRLGLTENSQFGLDLAGGEAAAGCDFILRHAESFQWVCLHLHLMANAQDSRQHRHYINQALEFLRQMKSRHGAEVAYLDIGGGFGVPTCAVLPRIAYAWYRLFGTLPPRPAAEDYEPPAVYMRKVLDLVVDFCGKHALTVPKLIIEPGRVLVSRAEVLLTRVNGIKTKTSGLNYALTDVGKHSIAYPCDYEYHDILAANKLSRMPSKLYHIVGRICTSADLLARHKFLPPLERGDVLAILDAGAYFSSYASNFAFQRPAILKVSHGQCELLRCEEAYDHLVAMDSAFQPKDTGRTAGHDARVL